MKEPRDLKDLTHIGDLTLPPTSLNPRTNRDATFPTPPLSTATPFSRILWLATAGAQRKRGNSLLTTFWSEFTL